MESIQSLKHTKWDCKCYIVWIPKYRKKVLYCQLRKYLGEVIRDLAQQKESRVWEGHLMPDHAHILVSIPPKYAVAQVVGYIKGKSAIYVARNFGNRRKNFTGERFWAKGYCVSTVGLDEEKIRKHVKWQLEKDKRMEQLKLWH